MIAGDDFDPITFIQSRGRVASSKPKKPPPTKMQGDPSEEETTFHHLCEEILTWHHDHSHRFKKPPTVISLADRFLKGRVTLTEQNKRSILRFYHANDIHLYMWITPSGPIIDTDQDPEL